MAWQVGEKLKDGRYTIEQVLGHSGFGQTYVALRNASNSERVVLKHLKKEDGEDDKSFRDRQTAFTNEAIRLASCEHSHIVKVRPESFWEGDLVHMVMEHIQGENLEVLVKQRQKPLPLDEALRYITQVASALEHIHNFDPPLIHRDVKPANIGLRSQNREAVLVDFGSAKEVRTDASLSQKATFTPAYSPIEIYSGVKKDTYTDVYSLGATLYFLLTNREPSPSQQRVIEDVPPPIELNPHVSQRVNDAIVTAMEIKPKDRVQTVAEFMQRLGLKPSIIHQGLQGLFGAKVAPSNPQVDKQIAEQAAKIAATEKQAKLERLRREQVEQQLQQLEADKQRLAREQQRADVAERQQLQRAEQEQKIELRSAKGIDYRELEKLLKDKQWHIADQLTDKLMLKVMAREKEGYLTLKNIKNFHCEDLQTIDHLWVHYSNGLYGFSVQKQIYVECGGNLDFSYPSPETWDKFCDGTAWKSEGNWVSYPQLFFKDNFMCVKGHLPMLYFLELKSKVWGYFFSRIETCEV